MLNLDPSLLDQDAIRLKRRKKLLIVSIVPVLVLITLFIFFIRTTIFNIGFSMGVESVDYNMTDFLANTGKIANLIEPYIAYYDKGYTLLARANNQKELYEAELEFGESLKYNPPEEMLCNIYGNYSYAIELQADLEYNNKDYNSAVVTYNRAEALLYENGCASRKNDNNDKDQKSKESKERVESKRRKAIAAANNTTDDGGDTSKTEGQQISDEDLKKLLEDQTGNETITIQNLQWQRGYDDRTKNIYDSDRPNF